MKTSALTSTFVLGAAFTLTLGALGCATTNPPPELVEARSTYARATTGPAAAYMPADLENARQALAKAETAFNDSPTADATRDLSYIASRKALLAEARGRIAESEKARTGADTEFKNTAEQKLNMTKEQLEAERMRGASTTAALTAERAARVEAEKKAKEALDRLSALASIKEETRGTVITLSGSVLFATDKSDLLPTAAERLNQVADALKEQPDRSVTVLGFTDSQGNDDYNMKLSQRRAESVRSYLVSRGIPTDTIQAVGRGKADPVASNANAEGRANNRRVEVVLAPAKQN
ncbi:MAG: OmpA family protein [Polyangiaceae bacterium]